MSTPLPSPDVLETIVHRALATRDMQGVVYALKLMAVQDPHRAQLILDTIDLGISISRRGAM